MESIFQTHERNTFRVFYQYIGVDRSRPDEPCMVLGSKGQRRAAWVIPLSVAHIYANSATGAPTEYLVGATIKIAQALGLSPDKYVCRDIADAILDNLPELLAMPPAPEEDTKAKIERAVERHGLNVSVNGEKVVH